MWPLTDVLYNSLLPPRKTGGNAYAFANTFITLITGLLIRSLINSLSHACFVHYFTISDMLTTTFENVDKSTIGRIVNLIEINYYSMNIFMFSGEFFNLPAALLS